MNKYRKQKMIHFLDDQIKWIVLLVLSSLLGTMLAIMKRGYEPLFFTLYQFMNLDVEAGRDLAVLKDSIIVYGVQLGMIWLCGLVPIMRYLGIVIFLMIGIAYSFTVTSMMLLYGIAGIFITLCVCGIQMVVVLYMMISISQNGWMGEKKGANKRQYYSMIGRIIAIAIVLGSVNFYIQPYLEKVARTLVR